MSCQDAGERGSQGDSEHFRPSKACAGLLPIGAKRTQRDERSSLEFADVARGKWRCVQPMWSTPLNLSSVSCRTSLKCFKQGDSQIRTGNGDQGQSHDYAI